MTYKLKEQESVFHAIKRIAQEQIEKGIKESIAIDELGVDETVHQVRKRLKKIRAVLLCV